MYDLSLKTLLPQETSASMSSLKRPRPCGGAEEWAKNTRPAKQVAVSSTEWPLPSDYQFAADASTYEFTRGVHGASDPTPFVSDEATATFEQWDENVYNNSTGVPQWFAAQTGPVFHDWLWDGRETLRGLDSYTPEEVVGAEDPVVKEQFRNGLGTPLFPALATNPLSTPEALDYATSSDFTTPTAACSIKEDRPFVELCFGTVRTSDISLLPVNDRD